MSKKNLKVILTVGVPGSSKSTWAQKFISENEKYVRINRDDYRFMLKNAPVTNYKVEELISALCNNAIISALNANFNVIVDNTHLKLKYINQVKELVKHKADVEFKVFDVPLETAIERDSKRSRIVGSEIITKMYSDFINLKNTFDFSSVEKQNKFYDGRIKESELPLCVVCDLDGTLAHHNNKRSIFDWQQVIVDDLDERIKLEIELHKNNGTKVLIVTGRDGLAKTKTIEWLSKHDVHYDELFMKGENDQRKDVIVKREIYDNFIKDKYNVLFVYEDRSKVVEMWRALGLKVMQVENLDN